MGGYSLITIVGIRSHTAFWAFRRMWSQADGGTTLFQRPANRANWFIVSRATAWRAFPAPRIFIRAGQISRTNFTRCFQGVRELPCNIPTTAPFRTSPWLMEGQLSWFEVVGPK